MNLRVSVIGKKKISTQVSAHVCPKDGSVLIAVSAKQSGQFDRVFAYRWSRHGLQKMANIAAVSVGSVAVIGNPDACLVVVGQRSVAGADTPTSLYRYFVFTVCPLHVSQPPHKQHLLHCTFGFSVTT